MAYESAATLDPKETLNSAARRAAEERRVMAWVGKSVVFKGTLTSSEDMTIDGRVEGDIRSVGLVIGENAEVHGEIFAEDVTVRGKVMGRIRARKVLLAATSRTSSGMLRREPSRTTCRSCSTRSSLTCNACGRSPISSRNKVPPLAASNQPARAWAAPV